MNPFLSQIIVYALIISVGMFLVSYLASLIENTTKKVISHYYSTKLSYMQALVEKGSDPIPLDRSLV
ncbi:MAG: hypothetical protein ACJ788_24445 [Ktedonobacteraceae bacterium]